MRAAHSLPYWGFLSGGLLTETPWTETPRQRPPDRDPQTETPLDRDPLDRHPLDRDPPWTETPQTGTPWTDMALPRIEKAPWKETPHHVTCDACWGRDQTVNRMTHMCKTLSCPKLRLREVNMYFYSPNFYFSDMLRWFLITDV